MPGFRHSLDPIFQPRSVAVLGASATPGSVGSILLQNLLTNPFGGVVYPINPKRRAVHGVLCYPDLSALPEVPDLAVIATPATSVPALVSECVDRGVPAAIIISAGFLELGQAGRDLEARILAVARGKMRIIGPNCLGVIHPPTNLNASFAADMAKPGHVALFSQSGAICTSILDWAREAHVGFSTFISVGAMLDVDFADLIDYFADDPGTRSIILYMESIGDVRKFLSAARGAARTKHVILVKSGRHEAGADAVFDAAFRRAGVLRVMTIPDLFNMSEILAMQPPPRGPALALVTNANGPGVMAIDELMTHGGQLAVPGPETMAALDAALPPFWSHANPIDILADATPERYRLAVKACLADPAVQGLLVLLAPRAMTDPTETARQLTVFAKTAKKPLLACWLGGASVRAGRDVLNHAGIPTFDSPESAIRAFLHMVRYRNNQELLYERPEALPENWQPNSGKVHEIIAAARNEGRTLLNEAEAKELLAAYDLPMVPSLPCRKHALADAFEDVPVQPMVKDKGFELIVGSSIDRQFGPVILFGAGGILVELIKDSSLALPPLNRTLAKRLMERTQIYKVIQGVRGQASVDLGALETLLVRFSQLLCDFPEIYEVDLNPILASPERVRVMDARVLLGPANQPEQDRPKLAFPPYPNQYTAPSTLRDGTEVIVRAIRPEDEPLLIDLHARHSARTIRMRFFSLVKTLSRDSLIRLCHLDYDREMALVAVHTKGDKPMILGVSRYYLHRETGEAEFALVVSDSHQRLGLGRHLLGRLIAIAKERGVKKLIGQVLRENAPMLALTTSLGFSAPVTVEEDVVKVERDLSPGEPGA
jgi:acetyltransferase